MADFFIGQSWLFKKKKKSDTSFLKAKGMLWIIVFLVGVVTGMTLDGSLRLLDQVARIKPAAPAAAVAPTTTSPAGVHQGQ